MKALIFGSNGQDGYYLSNLLRLNKIEVIGVDRSLNTEFSGDVSNFESVQSLIKFHLPEYIFHFAAISSTKHYALFANHATISTGTLNILESGIFLIGFYKRGINIYGGCFKPLK